MEPKLIDVERLGEFKSLMDASVDDKIPTEMSELTNDTGFISISSDNTFVALDE